MKNPIFGRTKLFWTTLFRKIISLKGANTQGQPLHKIYEIRFKGAYLRVCPCEIIDLKYLYTEIQIESVWDEKMFNLFFLRHLQGCPLFSTCFTV